MGQHQKEGPIPVGFYEAQRLVRQTVREVFAVFALLQPGNVKPGSALVLVREEVRTRLSCVMRGDVDVKSLELRIVRFSTQMPLAYITRHVPNRLKRVTESDLLQRKLADVFCLEQLAFLLSADPVREVQAGGVLAGHDARSCGRADGAGRVELRKPGALRSEPIDVRSLIKHAAVHTGIDPTHVVDDDEHDVGWDVAAGHTTQRQ